MPAEFSEVQVAFAELILECNLIELDVLQSWIDSLDVAPNDMGETLIQKGLLKEFELVNGLSKYFGLSVASEIELEMYAVPHPLIPRELCTELLFIPLSEALPNPFPIAISNPMDEQGLDHISELLGGLELKVSLASPIHLRHEITSCYGTQEEWEVYKLQKETESASTSDQVLGQDDELNALLGDLDADELLHAADQAHLDINQPDSTNVSSQDSSSFSTRPSSLPDWSKLADDDAGVNAFKTLIDQH